METDNDLRAIQACITNRLDAAALAHQLLAGVIGAAPSHYSKSPAIWNAAFRLLNLNAIYLPFDVAESRLRELTAALRGCARALGVNVTVPHKLKVMEYLDEVDAVAKRVQAVNTIVRTGNGRLIGYNTDGQGFVESLLEPQPGDKQRFVESLNGMNVLLLGAGGSARAVAFHMSELLIGGQLVICNRTVDHARSLAEEIKKIGADARAISEEELPKWAPKAGLIVNCTIKGQGGMRKLENGSVTNMAPYSALAPARPLPVPESEYGKPDSQDFAERSSQLDIKRNNEASLAVASSVPKTTGFYDLIYFPEETVFLRHGRLTGHRTQNGKAMIIGQAALAFYHRICRAELQSRRLDNPDTFKRILAAMYRAW